MVLVKKGLISVLVVYLVYGVYLSQFELNVLEPKIHRNHPEGYFDYSGVLNIHSDKSTGSGNYSEIVKAAQASGLDFIFINELNEISPDKNYEKYFDHLLVFVDSEVSYLDSKILFYGKSNYSDFTSIGQAQALIADKISNPPEESEGTGLMVLAHPFKRGHKWPDNLPLNLNGIEILNLKSIWQSVWLENKPSFIWSMLIYPFNPELSLLRMFPFPKREFKLWDRINKSKPTLGFAGADADAKLKYSKGLQIPSYQTFFNIVRTHILIDSELTGDFNRDSIKVKTALEDGKFYMSLDKMADPVGFNALIHNSQNEEVFSMGSKITWTEGLELRINFPQNPLFPIDVMVFKDGENMLSSNSLDTRYFIPAPGTYRVVVRIIPTFPLPDGKKWVPWIITNPFFIGNN